MIGRLLIRRLISMLAAVLVMSGTVNAHAFWVSSSTNYAEASADTLQQAATPSVVALTTTSVGVAFGRVYTLSGRPVTRYLVARYSSPGAVESESSFICEWPVSTPLGCSETAVPDGTWYYAVSAGVSGSAWLGLESARTGGLQIDTTPPSPPSTPDLDAASDSGSSADDNITNLTTLTFNGSAEAGSTVKLFDGAAPVGSGIAGGGSYSIVVANLSEGAHNIRATATDGAGNASTSSPGLPVTVDLTAPLVTSTVIAKQIGYLSGAIKQSGSYYVYAAISETGSSVLSATGNLTSVTSEGSAVNLTSGSYSANGVVYNYRSALQAATSGLTAGNGTRAYSVASSDVAGNASNLSGISVTVDNTAPFATDIQTANGGGLAGRAEPSDTVTFTFSEQMDPSSIISGWNGSSTGVTVRLIDGGCVLVLCSDDSFQIWNQANSSQLPLGSVGLGRSDYHGGGLLGTKAPLTFGATGTPSTMVQSGSAITITLGTASGTADTAGGNGSMQWSPATSPYDRAGNNMTGTTVNESGSVDREF